MFDDHGSPSGRVCGLQLPEALDGIQGPERYKVAYGGRGGAKSWGFAEWLLAEAIEMEIRRPTEPWRVLCGREYQKSISDSVHRLLCDQIVALGMQDNYSVEQARIYGRGGSEFTFAGLRHNIDNIKSVEGTDRLWFEEAQNASRQTWEKLIPTIRKDGSQIFVTFNPELDTDETYKRFVINTPPSTWLKKITWRDNPWFPKVLRDEKDHMQATDPDAYLTVWEGHCRQTLDGAIFAKEIRVATEENRITKVPYDRSKPVHTFWDLGRRDYTAIWFAQVVGFEFRILSFYQNRGLDLQPYLMELRARNYLYGECWLPHDAENELLASRRTIKQQMEDAGFTVKITPKISVADGINAARTIFANSWFDADGCADGLNSLRRYRYGVDDRGQYTRLPLHDPDGASDGADAFRYLAISLRERKAQKFVMPPPRLPVRAQVGGWMR